MQTVDKTAAGRKCFSNAQFLYISSVAALTLKLQINVADTKTHTKMKRNKHCAPNYCLPQTKQRHQPLRHNTLIFVQMSSRK